MSETDDLEKRIVLVSTHDIKVQTQLMPQRKYCGNLRGMVTRVNNRGGIIFFIFHDGLGYIQIIANKNDFSNDDWKVISSIKILTRMAFEATVEYSAKGRLSLCLKKLPTIYEDIPVHSIPYKNDRITSQILISRLCRFASDKLIEQGYLEIEPMYLSTTWNETGIEPLKVIYQGYGSPAYLVPSPHPQLLNTIIVSGRNEVFCISKCFTLTYRDSITGAESHILSARILNRTLDEVITITEKTIKKIFNYSCYTFNNLEWLRKDYEWACDPPVLNVKEVEIQTFRKTPEDDPSFKEKRMIFFRICCPPDVIIAEGFSEKFGCVPLGSFTIHLERIAKLLGPIELRRIFDLCNLKIKQ